MADYYPLLSKAVTGLKTSTPETRGAIYERARKALLGQLRNMQPPAPEAAIEREARALDEAIARIELDFAGTRAPAEETPTAAPEEKAPAAPNSSERPAAEEPESGAPERSAESAPAETADEMSAGRENLRPAAPKPPRGSGGGLRRFVILGSALAAVVVLVAGAAWKLRDRPEDLAKLAPAPQKAEQQTSGKIEQRVGAATPAPQPASPPIAAPPANPAPAPAQSVPIAYRAAVLIQAASEPGGVKTYVGTVVWRRDSVNSGPNRQLTDSIRADIDVPDAGLKASMTIEKNYDATLSASHTITVHFDPAPNSVVGNVKAINVPEMRRDDAPRGAPLQGMEVDVAPNLFLVGLYSASLTANIEMIRSLAWFDIPMSLADGRIA
ncbi:hypothetical protein, partial [Rhodoblastus sp.]|uniref:hypothetical protein n=1 Tax=Rhodoblastus sp. TaxID=1962975 RepID=UPI003FD7DB71